MQAAKTVKDSDPSYNGWSAAAAQYRKAAAAFEAAGDLAQAAAAAEQAQTLENALKIANQQAAQAASQSAVAGVPAGNAGQPQSQQPQQQAAAPQSSSAPQQSADCSTITGLGDGAGPTNCGPSSGVPANVQAQMAQAQPPAQAQAEPAAPSPRRAVVLALTQCKMCDVLKSVGEVLPDLAEKLNDIKAETIIDAEPPLFDGGPNTVRPFLPRRPLAPVSALEDPVKNLDDIKDITSDIKELSELAEKNKEPEDYAEKCRDGFLDAAWKAFTASEGSYVGKAKAAKESVTKCIKAAVKHIKDTIANGGVDPAASSEDN